MNDRTDGPQIDGLTFVEHLGAGGYSDVYLYEQRRPRMRVAVKVLTDARLSDAELAQFADEAETMAELADHPYIVQVFSTGSTDDGRPYLVMKYYPPPNLGKRAATQRLSVAETLRTGIQISSAVETAHRAGILHRDIKPANILISQYGEPGLADFGIAGKAVDSDDDEDLGVSIPWSPPEILSGASNGSIASDVYSLAATLWHLLAGRSPHEVPGGDNSPRALMGRILRSPPPATGRADAPASLERILQQAMSRHPHLRPASALEFARLLQGVEQELRYARTAIVVEGTTGPVPAAAPVESVPPSRPDTSPFAPAAPGSAPDEPPTTLRPPLAAAQGAVPAPVRPPTSAAHPALAVPQVDNAAPPAMQRQARPVAQHPPEGTRLRPLTPSPQLGSLAAGRVPDDPPPTTRRAVSPSTEPVPPPARQPRIPRAALIAAASVVCLLAVAIALVLLNGSTGGKPQNGRSPSGPVGTGQGGLGAATIAAPVVTHSYDAATATLLFRWTTSSRGGSTPSGLQYVYSLNGGAPVGPTPHTSLAVKTRTPSSECLVVGSVGSDGTRHLAAPACG